MVEEEGRVEEGESRGGGEKGVEVGEGQRVEGTIFSTRVAWDTAFIEISLVPRLSGMRTVHTWRAWYIFSRDHDVIEIGPEFLEQKVNVLRVIQPTWHSMLGVYDIGPPIVIYV